MYQDDSDSLASSMSLSSTDRCHCSGRCQVGTALGNERSMRSTNSSTNFGFGGVRKRCKAPGLSYALEESSCLCSQLPVALFGDLC